VSGAFRLDGRVALVTGASRGIGRAVAVELTRAGAHTALIGRDVQLLDGVASEVHALGGKAVACVADVQDRSQIAASVATCASTLGPVDVLVNNAGVSSRGSLDEVSDEEWSRVLEVNLSSAFHYARAVAGGMCERRWGRIVNIASISAQTGGVSGSVAYSSSKGGLIAFTKTLARDLAPHGVTVNAVAPGQIQTAMGTEVSADELARIVADIPIGRLGTPADVAHAVRFLASDEAGYITGTTLDVNGGILRR
jgi:3-oxoacyl-[acyl-carrier protein] reductase